MPRPLQIGITGGIGSGKSLICKIFAKFGIPVYDADSHAKDIMTTDGILVSAIKKEFGDLSYASDGSLNRVYLAEHVFNRQEKLNQLNALVHPRVAEDYRKWTEKNAKAPYVIKEAALLFESGSNRLLNRVIVVRAGESLRINRVLQRDRHRSVEQVKAIVGKQMPEDEKAKLADHIIVNDETQLVLPQVLQLHGEFLLLARTAGGRSEP